MALYTILRAIFGYLFLVLMVRIVGRRPGKQLTPFEFVLVFYLGGLTLTGMVGMEVSLTNAVCQIVTVALCHYVLSWLRYRFDAIALLLDGSPLFLLEDSTWRTNTLRHMGLQDDDVMDMAREQGIKDLSGVKVAILETFGAVTIVPHDETSKPTRPPEMPHDTATDSVQDSVPKVDDAIAVGENLQFQRKWWRFESAIWLLFLLILIADVLGAFGRGWLAKATIATPDHALTIDYERIARASTPSVMTLNFGPAAIHDGVIQIFVSDAVVKPLGAQRISPQPLSSAVGNDGIAYTFQATQAPATVQIALEPSFPGVHTFRAQLRDEPALQGRIVVVP